MIRNIKQIIGLFLFAVLLQSNTAGAALPYSPDLVDNGNLWRFTFYNDAGDRHEIVYTELICFDYDDTVGGNHLNYRWFSQSDDRFTGRASQEGDKITMIGHARLGPFSLFNDIEISKAHQWQLTSTDEVNKTTGTGHHQLYLQTRVDEESAHMNLVAKRIGNCQGVTPRDINTIPSLLNDSADILRRKVREILKDAEGFNQSF